MPYFFVEAKGYKGKQIEPINNSFVNTLRQLIKKKRLSFQRFNTFSYKKLMCNPEKQFYDENVIECYEKLGNRFHIMNNADEHGTEDNIPYLISESKKKLLSFEYCEEEILDMLIFYLFTNNSEAKLLLWACFGETIYKNLKHRVNPRERYCVKCGRRFIPRGNNHKYCDSCFTRKIQTSDERIVVCIDCGKEFLVPKSVRNKKRCADCQLEHNREYERLKKRRQRAK